ncbi:NLP/P60 family protein [Paenibacillus mucilaginosus 3016]|uniref:NLP/P60 family protein n=2 Tax=Paenibacillus mucilaginosus TaxID=61624 RepID=H6NBK5_9BACL|nr:C40 family peptidase [Paenibacillus mucilaginosus]AFC33774.1 NLP/P60 family protein [Paenibacillus mucilaginosus 3016]AFH66105.1 hydrolase Nlp/P60 [Paenibacillus mucilaginosus K02]WFA22168.1 NlpC/P60 family protein [Paenibacillus mucilaginosus]
MKKQLVGLTLALSLFCGISVGSAYAETPLSAAVNDGLGAPYKWSGTTKSGFDCSGYTSWVFAKFGVDLPHTSKGQAAMGTWVDKDNLRAGDLVFFNTDGKGISHVGVYVGEGKFYHSATNQGVTITKLSEGYYAKRYVTARRVLSDAAYEQLMTDK